MARAELRWPPHPYRAGFCITDDTDAAELATVRAVYDVLATNEIRTTKTVWAFPAVEPCGIPALPGSIQRGITLEDPDYLTYCEKLAERGFEITLHGATAGNNRRETILRAFDRLDRHFPPAGTYICHAKNADNPYWQEKTVARGPLRWALSLYARGHRCSGEDPASPYFWGDLCLRRVRYIRLLRTRNFDTLAANPSMPYYEPEKPYVRSWFSATKRSFREATSDETLTALERDWGLCVLYQYLCRYADPAAGGVKPAFARGVGRLRAHPKVWADTASSLLDRLRLVQAVFVASRGRELWIANTNDEPATDLQIETSAQLASPGARADFVEADGVVRVAAVAPGELLRLEFTAPVEAHGRTATTLDARGHGRTRFAYGEALMNAGPEPWMPAPGVELPPGSCAVRFDPGFETLRPRSRASDTELTKLFLEQSAIIAREYLFKGRAVNSNQWLGAKEIALEDHDNW